MLRLIYIFHLVAFFVLSYAYRYAPQNSSYIFGLTVGIKVLETLYVRSVPIAVCNDSGVA